MIHSLNTQPENFDAIVAGTKTYDIQFNRFNDRANDRMFKVGDHLQFRECLNGSYTGRQTWREITSVYPGTPDDSPLSDEYIVLGFAELSSPPALSASTRAPLPSFHAISPQPSGVVWEPVASCYAEVTARGGLYVRREIEAVHVRAFLTWANDVFPDVLRGIHPKERERYE